MSSWAAVSSSDVIGGHLQPCSCKKCETLSVYSSEKQLDKKKLLAVVKIQRVLRQQLLKNKKPEEEPENKEPISR